MMQFNVNGEFLELPNDLSLDFTKQSTIFCFDDLECGRTAEFSVPATSKNNTIFGFAADYHTHGDAVRHKISAQMQAGIIVEDGYLVITSVDKSKNTYGVAFYFGVMASLASLTQEGNISEYYTPADTCVWNADYQNAGGEQMPVDNLVTLANYAYGIDPVTYPASDPSVNRFKPSISLYGLARDVLAANGVTLSAFPGLGTLARFIPKTPVNSAGKALVFGDTVELRYNMPELTAADLLKIIATLQGAFISVTGANSIAIKTRPTGTIFNLDGRVIERGAVERLIDDFSQNNFVVGYDKKGDDDMREVQAANYTQENDFAEKEDTVAEIPDAVWLDSYEGLVYDDTDLSHTPLFNGARALLAYRTDAAYPFDFILGANTLDTRGPDNVITKPYLVKAVSGGQGYPTITKNAFIQSVLDEGTTLEVKARMSLPEYAQVTDDTFFQYDGVRWSWISAEWGDYVCNLKLVKLP